MWTRILLLALCSCISDQLFGQAELQGSLGATRLAIDSGLQRYRQAQGPRSQAAALAHVGILLNAAGQRDSALQVFQTVLTIARAVHDTAREASSHKWLGYLFEARGGLDTTIQHYREAAVLRTALGQADEAGVLHRLIGGVFERLNRADSALAHFALSIAASSDSTSSVFASTVGRIGRMYWQQRQVDSAAGAFLRATRLSRSGNRLADAALWTNWACYARAESGTVPDEAIRVCRDAVRLFRDLRSDSTAHEEVLALRRLAAVVLRQGRADTATYPLREAIAIAAHAGLQSDEGVALLDLGDAFDHLKEWDSAGTAFSRAAITLQRDTTNPLLAATVARIGRMYSQRRLMDSAAIAFLRAARLYAGANRAAEAAVWTNWACYARVASGALSEEATRLCSDALRQFRNLGADSLPHEQVLALQRLATAFRQRKLADTALAQLREAVALAARTDRHDEGQVLFDLGATFDQLHDADSAAAAFARAAIIFRERGETVDLANALDWQCYELTEGSAPPNAALTACHDALRLFAGDSSIARRARVRQRLARIFRSRTALDSAAANLERAVDEFRAAKLPIERARALRSLCEVRIDAKHTTALHTCQESLADFHRLARDDSTVRGDEARALQVTAWAYRRLAQHDSSHALLRAALATYERLDDHHSQAGVLYDLGVTYRALSQFDSAAAVFSRAIALQRALASDSTSLNQLLVFLGTTELDRGRQEAAIAAFREALGYFESRNDGFAVFGINVGIARAFRAIGQPDSARLYLPSAAAAPSLTVDDVRVRMAQARSTGDADGMRQALSDLARLFAKLGQRDSALVYYTRSLTESRHMRDVEGEIVALRGLAELHAEIGAGDSAISEYQMVAALARSRGEVSLTNAALTFVSTLYREQGKLDSALFYAREVQAAWERAHNERDALTPLTLVAAILLDQGRFDSAIAVTDTALRRAQPLADHMSLGAAYATRGTAFSSLGQYDSALVDLRAALTELHRADSHQGEQHLLGALGSVFRFLGRSDSALVYHRLQMGAAIAGAMDRVTPAALDNLALDFDAAGARDSALWYQKMRLTFADGLKDRGAMADALVQISTLYNDLGQTDTASVYLWRALTVLTDSLKRTPPALVRAELLGDIGTVHRAVGQLDSALAYETLSLSKAHENGDQDAEALALTAIATVQARMGHPLEALQSLRDALASSRAAGSLEATAGTLDNIGHTLRQLPIPDRHGALAAFDSASVVLAAVRQHAGADANRIGLTEQALSRSAPGEWEMTWLSIADSIGMEQAALGALAASERGRAQALLDLMRRTTSAVRAGNDFVAEGRRFVKGRTGAAVLSFLVTADTLIRWLAVPGNALQVSRQTVPRDSLGTLVGSFRAALGVGDAARSSIAFRGGDAIEGDTLDALRSGVAPSASRRKAEPLNDRLARLLLPPDLRHNFGATRELVIVPHGVLGLVPFAALPLDSGNTPFGSVYALRYAPSLAVLGQVESRAGLPTGAARSAALNHAVVVGNPTMPATSAWGEAFVFGGLPGATREAEAVAGPLGVRTLTGNQATESEVRRRLPTAPVVHLATHGFAYSKEARARLSFVALAPDDRNDGFLTVGEILDDSALTLSADLVVLSACQTGLGDLKQAEGTVGLQRAFLAKGARSILVSLWNVSDEATALLMKSFYAHWLSDPDHPSKAEALRRAQERVRSEPRFSNPRFWAAFQLVGAH